MVKHPNLGFVYYVDHQRKVNTVDDPRKKEDRVKQEELLKKRVMSLRHASKKHRATLRKKKQTLEQAKSDLDDKVAEAGEGSEEAQALKKEYRRQLSQTTRVERVVEEGEAKIEALEKIKFDEMSVTAAQEVKEELARLNQNYEAEAKEKMELKNELQELRTMVQGYMKDMKLSREDLTEIATEAARQEATKLQEENIRKEEEMNAGVSNLAMTTKAVGNSMNSLEIKMELEQKKLEIAKQREEMKELKKVKATIRKLKKEGLGTKGYTYEDGDLPDWIFSQHIIKLLSINENDYTSDKDLQEEIMVRVKGFMDKAHKNRDSLDFHSKLAFFSTAAVHDEVEKREKRRSKIPAGVVVAGEGDGGDA